FPRPRSSGADPELGRDAQRRTQSPVRCAASGDISGARGDAGCARLQFVGRRMARLARSAHTIADGSDGFNAIEEGSAAPAVLVKKISSNQSAFISSA